MAIQAKMYYIKYRITKNTELWLMVCLLLQHSIVDHCVP
jgi:hypothetical protein